MGPNRICLEFLATAPAAHGSQLWPRPPRDLLATPRWCRIMPYRGRWSPALLQMTPRRSREGGVTASFPDFERPPVVEVALSVSFDTLAGLTAADLGVLWHLHYKPRGFRWTQDQPPVRVVPEQFGPASGLPSVHV